MRHVAVSNDLNRAIVIVELLGSNHVRGVAMNVTIDADDILHHAGYSSDVVRYHHDSHFVIEFVQKRIEFVLEVVVNEVGRLVEYEQLGACDNGTTE